ncbi:MAG: hypothetical protein Q9227_005959 [Pyrenula ochraceoflavens]
MAAYEGQILCPDRPEEDTRTGRVRIDYKDDGAKKRAACDECRQRKLKCSGEPDGCSRCLKQGIPCHYSTQKQMGRPRKRQRPGELENLYEDGFGTTDLSADLSTLDPELSAILSSNEPFVDADSIPASAEDIFLNGVVCPKPYSSYIRNYNSIAPSQSHLYNTASYGEDHNLGIIPSSEGTPPSDSPPTPPSPGGQHASHSHAGYPEPAPWNIDFTNFALPSMLSSTSTDNSVPTLPPTCPCLPNLYLTLSTLHTLTSQPPPPSHPSSQPPPHPQSSFPLPSPASLTTLRTASVTAHSVLHCPVCPCNFQSGMTNVMLLCTLLTVLGDLWGRLSRAPVSELKQNFAKQQPNDWSDDDWRAFRARLVRRGVYGEASEHQQQHDGPQQQHSFLDSNGNSDGATLEENGEKSYPLTYLIDSMERRQKTWHGEGEFQEEFPGHKESADMGRKVVFRRPETWGPGEEGKCISRFRKDGGEGGGGGVGRERGKNGVNEEQEQEEEEHLCVKIVDNVRRVIEQLKLDD